MRNPVGFLVIIGSPGSGKTYFCAALASWILQNFNTYRYWDEDTLFQRLKEGFDSAEGSPKHLQYMIDDQLVILDDVGSLGYSKWNEQVLFSFIDRRCKAQMPTVFTSNLSVKEFHEMYNPRLTSRLLASKNLVIDLEDSPDLRKMGM
jgi:DNA replication protein DnaC